ncbi:hypothetical protein BG000_011542 [Podila horticola]|nr:hypothetical protein BG000_011542 [Podila horticola]
MFDLPELDILICTQLDQQSLVQCALVCKKWNRIASPFVWQDPCLFSRRNEDLFRGIVLEDFLLEQKKSRLRLRKLKRLGEKTPSIRKKVEKMRQDFVRLTEDWKQQHQKTYLPGINPWEFLRNAKREQELQRELDSYPRKLQDLCDSILGPVVEEEIPHLQKSLLARYGPSIHAIPNVYDLLEAFQSPSTRKQIADTEKRQHRMLHITELEAGSDPSEFELLRHLFSRCTNLRFPKVQLFKFHLGTPRLLDLIIEFIIPVTTHLAIDYEFAEDETNIPLTTTTLKRVLSNATSTLQTLTIEIDCLMLDEAHADSDIPGARELKSSIRDLQLYKCGESVDSIKFWNWLWKRCGKVEKLAVLDVLPPFVQSLARGINAHMPNIECLYLGRQTFKNWIHLRDPELELLLAAHTNTYKLIQCDVTARPGPLFAKALRRHCSTLEEFWVAASAGDDSYLVDILIHSPKLRTFISIQDGDHPVVKFPEVSAKRFIDWDSETLAYRPWACESTLVGLSIKITGVPTKAGDERKSQHGLLYDRIARMSGLRLLALGHNIRIVDERRGVSSTGLIQEDCLAMTLDSGLEKLKPLVNLTALNLFRMRHEVGLHDVKWMVQNWPKLKLLQGLEIGGDAYKYIQKHYPHLLTLEG